jgi:glucosamine 6-phosphate synthetase-like amidotransferase/phosphosugar isomerase protein
MHFECHSAGVMKHGPIALLDAKVPAVLIAVPFTELFDVLFRCLCWITWRAHG